MERNTEILNKFINYYLEREWELRNFNLRSDNTIIWIEIYFRELVNWFEHFVCAVLMWLWLGEMKSNKREIPWMKFSCHFVVLIASICFVRCATKKTGETVNEYMVHSHEMCRKMLGVVCQWHHSCHEKKNKNNERRSFRGEKGHWHRP